MIRNIGEKIFKNKKVLLLIDRLSFIVLLCGICYIFYVARESDYSKIEENALTPTLNKLLSQHQIMTNEHFKNISESMEEYTEQSSVISFLEKFFDQNNMEYAIQNFTQKTERGVEQRQNIAGIYRVQRSNNYECNLIAFDINPVQSKISIPFALSFAKYYEHHKINYVSRDVIFLGYDSRGKNFGYSVEQFLKLYLSESSNIPKCGVIRQALNIDLENNFNQLYLKSLGFDGKVPDRDYFLGFNYLFKEAFNESGYKYTEVSSKIPVLFGNFLERILHEVGKQLQVVFPANFFNNFKYFFHILIAGIYGEKHDAHSQMIYYGIQALTIKGKQNPKVTSDFQTTLNNLFNVVDGGIRANFSLDEQLHAGSTLYYPVTKSTQITIKKLPIGLILIALPIAIQYLSVYFKSQGDQSINTFKVYGRHIITVFHSLFILVIPSFAEKLFPYAFPNQGNPVFCQDWSSINNPQLINLFLLFVCLTVGSRLLIKIVVEYIILKGIAKVSLKETRKDGDYSSTVNGLMIGLSAVLYLFINTSVSYIFLVVLSPFFYIQRPLIPRSARDFLRTAATIGALYLTYFILVQVQVNYYEETIEAVITYQCIPSHKLLFAVAILFNLTWNQVELFLI